MEHGYQSKVTAAAMEHGYQSKEQYIVGLLNLVNVWLVRGLVLSSFVAYLVLVLFAGVRRRSASGGRMLLLWLAYQVAELAATQALANLSLGSTSQELQLVAFWTPFLLMNISRPDNISAYSLEDNVLAGRKVLGAPAQVSLAIHVLYKHIIVAGYSAGTLLPASFIMFFGIVKYLESAAALWRGKLDNIRSSIKNLRSMEPISDLQSGGRELGNEQALWVAHEQFFITKGAFTDYSFAKKPLKHDRTSISRGWNSKCKCKVVELQLSLMYDIMYTKATVVHTWLGYSIRVLSPPFTAAAVSLFWLHSKDGQRRADVVITYTLLVATFILDVKWILGALGSTWTYAFMNDKYCPQSSLERWSGLRRFVVSLDPSRLFIEEPTNYRMWSGTIRQYNLLYECTHDTTGLRSGLVKIIATQDIWMEYHYGYLNGLKILPFVRDLLFETVWGRLKSVYGLDEEKPPPPTPTPPPEPPKPKLGQPLPEREIVYDPGDAQKNRRILGEALDICPEFQEVVLTWHIATEVFLMCRPKEAAPFKYVEAIKELSNYMMFLVAVHPTMLPGLNLSSLHEATRDALQNIWRHNKKGNPCCTNREKDLASILQDMEGSPGSEAGTSALYDSSVILSDGAQYAELMVRRLGNSYDIKYLKGVKSKEIMLRNLAPDLVDREGPLDLQQMLVLIFDAWVRLLIHASIRCSRESHAKQLGCGGELTTIVWILVEHAAIDHRTRRT